MPIVTLSLPIYNAERFLSEAVESIKAQTFTDFEVIAVLDGCTDRSEEILRDLGDERFLIINKKKNEGKTKATNFALFNSCAEFFGRMDADDIMHPDKLKRQVTFLRENPDIDVVGVYFDYINENSIRFRDPYPFPTTPDGLREGFKTTDCIGGAAALCRREKLVVIGGYDSELRQSEDLELWLHCLASGFRIANIPEILLHYRVHGQQDSNKQKKAMYELSNVAYRRHGKAIWGHEAPDVEFGASIPKRALRKIKRMLGLIK